MAKKKKTSKEKEKSQFNYSAEMIGLLLILIGILGFGFGPVGALIKKFAMFLVGELWLLIQLVVLFMGGYMLLKRKLPEFFTSRLIGFYILIIVVLVGAHFGFINAYEPNQIITKTMDSYQSRISTMGTNASIFTSGQESINIGGGIIGGGIAFVLDTLFGKVGAIIVLVALTIFGIVLMFDVNLSDVLNDVREKLLSIKERASDDEEDEEDDELEEGPISLRELSNVDTNSLTIKEEALAATTHVPVTPVTVASMIKEETAPLPSLEPVATKRGIYTLPNINLLDEVPKQKNVNNEFTKSN